MGNETPTMAEVIERGIDKRLLDLHVSLPAKIETYDGNKASVQPLLKRTFANGNVLNLPIITNVPILWQRAGKAMLVLPIKKGDTGTLLFSERSLDLWLVQGSDVDPADPRKFDLSDAQFIPGIYPFDNPPDFDAERIVLTNDKGRVTIGPTGKYSFSNGTEEIMTLLSDTLTKLSEITNKLSTTTTNTSLGANKLNDFAFFATKKTEVDTIKTKFDTLKE